MRVIYLLVIILSSLFLGGCSKCIKSHKEVMYNPPWTQFIWSGKIMIPIYHSGYYYTGSVCDEWEDKNE